MHSFSQMSKFIDLLIPLYHALYFVWPPFLLYLVRHHHRFIARLITLWTLSGALSVMMMITQTSPISTLPSFGPEPYNTVILVSLRLALLVLWASLLVRPRVVRVQV